MSATADQVLIFARARIVEHRRQMIESIDQGNANDARKWAERVVTWQLVESEAYMRASEFGRAQWHKLKLTT